MTRTAPTPATPAAAVGALEEHLPLVLKGSSIEDLGWTRLDPLTLLVPTVGERSDGSLDEFLLRLGFGYYPRWPPSAQFVNPSTNSYAVGQDEYWLPRVAANWFKTHANYKHNGRQLQLICCSATLEFYQVEHGVKDHHRWDPLRQNFAATINAVERALKPPHYQGRWKPEP